MPTSPLKRASGGRLGRLLASLRPPVQTGFPTSLADIVVKNHGRLRNSRRRHRGPGAAAPPPTAAAAAAAEPTPAPVSVSQERRELSVALDAAAPAPATATVTARPRPGKGAELSIGPELLAIGGAVALALLVVWSKQLVAAATLASVALAWIESARTVGRARRPETEPQELVLRRGRVSSIREAAAESPRPSCRAERERGTENGGGSDAASLWSAYAGASDDSSWVNNNNSPKLKRSRSSLRKLLATKLRSGSKTARGTSGSSHGGVDDACEHEHEHPETPWRRNAEPAAPPGEETRMPRPPELITDDDRGRRRRGRALPLPALVPVFLAGLVAGKLPALALAVLCLAFSSSVQRVPDSGGRSPR